MIGSVVGTGRPEAGCGNRVLVDPSGAIATLITAIAATALENKRKVATIVDPCGGCSGQVVLLVAKALMERGNMRTT
jgi:hypothetical protein